MGADLDLAIEGRYLGTDSWHYVLGTYLALRGSITGCFEAAGVDPTGEERWSMWCRDRERCTLSDHTIDCIGDPAIADPPYWIRVLTPTEFRTVLNGLAIERQTVPPLLFALHDALAALERLTTDAYRVVVWYGQ